MSGLLMRQVWPLALMLCADRVPIESPHLKCADPNGLSRSPERPYLHYVVMPLMDAKLTRNGLAWHAISAPEDYPAAL